MKTNDHTNDKDQEKQDLIKLSTLSIIILIILSLLYSGCYYSCDKYTYPVYEAVYMDIDSLRGAVDFIAPTEIGDPGGLYYKNGFVFINEKGKGIHIIDDTNPVAPVSVGFISIPGNFSLAAKSDYLYADSYTDILVFDISDPRSPELLRREENVFGDFSGANVYLDATTNSIVTYVETSYEDTDCDEGTRLGWQQYVSEDVAVPLNDKAGVDDTGEAGSMARFVVDGETLYAVDYSSLWAFDISSPAVPDKQAEIQLGWGIETIFPYESKLFIGAMDGMYIMDNSNKLDPQLLSKYEHTTSCDPVVVQGNYAYVTLRNGTECQGFQNQLDIVNISDPLNPVLVKTYQMQNPHGLDINGQCLFVCEGSHGLKSFNVSLADPTEITQTSFYKDVDAFDVISLPDLLLMVGKDGFYQYDYNCGGDLLFLSEIAFGADH